MVAAVELLLVAPRWPGVGLGSVALAGSHLDLLRSAVLVHAPGAQQREAGRAQRGQGAERRTPERSGGVAGASTAGTIDASPGATTAAASGNRAGARKRGRSASQATNSATMR